MRAIDKVKNAGSQLILVVSHKTTRKVKGGLLYTREVRKGLYQMHCWYSLEKTKQEDYQSEINAHNFTKRVTENPRPPGNGWPRSNTSILFTKWRTKEIACPLPLAATRHQMWWKSDCVCPPFWPEEPDIWFMQIEGQFALSGITN